MALQLVWDPNKDRINRRQHGISFETATHAFADPQARIELNRIEGGEERWQIVASITATVLVLVVYTSWEADNGEEIVRIISARKASTHERRKYENDKNVH